MPLGCAATQQRWDGMRATCVLAWVCRAEAVPQRDKINWENRNKRRSGWCGCEVFGFFFQKVYVGAAPRNRSNTVGPVVASLLRHEEKGRERGKKRKVLHRKIWQRFSSRLARGGREEEG